MNAIPQEKITEIKDTLAPIANATGDEFFEKFIGLLGLPDSDFELIAPGIMQSYQQSLNNPGDKLALVYALNAQGAKLEDLQNEFGVLCEQIDKSEFSQIKKDFLKEMIGSLLTNINDTQGISKRIVNVPIELCDERAVLPAYAHESDSGLDVKALEDITIHPGETKLVMTGIKIALPPGYEVQVRPRSGLSLKSQLRIANAPGTVDQEYRGEIGVIIDNIEPPIKDITIDENGRVTSILYGRDMYISAGQKICQLVLAEVPKIAWTRVEKVVETERGEGGFGSTGK